MTTYFAKSFSFSSLQLIFIFIILNTDAFVNCILNESYATVNQSLKLQEKLICLMEGDIVCPNGYLNDDMSYYLAPLDKNRLWLKRIVPFMIDSSYSDSQVKLIKEAVSDIETVTCVRFKLLTTEPNDDYVSVRPIKGCYSFIGRETGAQDLSLSADCFTAGKGIAIHEFIHALGIYHEHTRPDRDDYVYIHLEHVIPEMRSNFYKRNKNLVDLLGEPYDYYSIMHYSAYDFSIEPKSLPTIVPYDETVDVSKMGQRSYISELDRTKLNKLYKCDITHCSDPGSPLNGILKHSEEHGFDVGLDISFQCNDGFSLVGSAQRFCRYDGVWSGLEVICVRQLYHYCNFEQTGNEWCGWSQDSANKFNWERRSGSTPAEDTGPVEDFTFETSVGHYIFINTLPPQKKGDKSRVITPSFTSAESDYVCISFGYYMWGINVGVLSLYINDESFGDQLIWKQTGNRGPKWIEAKLAVERKPLESFKLIFEAVVGTVKLSDIAIDEVLILECNQQFLANNNYNIVNI